MKGNDLPIMRFHRGDYLRTTLGWPPIARLIYFELCGVQWDRGELPLDPDRLRMLVPGISEGEWSEAWKLIEPLLPVVGDGRRNASVEAERERTIRMREARRRGAVAANAKRWRARDGAGDG